MLCPLCALENRAAARYCDGCGAGLPAPGSAPAAALGRAREQAELAQLLGRMREGHGGTVALAGEPGIGKSHTAQLLARDAAAGGVRVLWGRCNEEPGAPPYWPWLQILRAWFDGHDDAMLRETLAEAAAPMADIAPEIAQRLPALTALPPTLDPLQQRFRLFDALAGFWKRAAARQPLLLILDDLHWADASSLKLLEFLAAELQAARLLLLVTYRDIDLNRRHPLSETLAELARQTAFERLRLRGLSRDETAGMIAAAGGSGLSAAWLDAVYSQTEGNPLFIVEMTRLLLQEGVLGRPDGTGAAQNPATLRIPEGVKEVIGRRLNRLSARSDAVLSQAALIGRVFQVELLQQLVGAADAEGLPLALEESLQACLIEAGQVPGEFRFSHALIRETLYDEIPLPRRSRLHLQVARAIEASHPGDLERHLPALAHHHTAALPGGDATRAADVAQQAAKRAMQLLAHEEAARYYRLALQAVEHGSARGGVLVALGEALALAGEYLQAREAFEAAATIARATHAGELLARAALGFEQASWRPGLPGFRAARLLREALDLQPGDSALKAQLLSSLARALIFCGEDDQAMRVEQQALAMARRSGDTPALIATLLATVSARWQPERSDERLRNIDEAARLAEGSGDALRAIEALSWGLFELMEGGDLPAWLALLGIYERRAAEMRQPFYQYIAATSRAAHALFEGRYTQAEGLIRQALQLGRRMPGLDASGVYGMQMFELQREQGGLPALAPLLGRLVQAMPGAGIWRPGLALIHAEIGQIDQARAEFEVLATDDFAAVGRDGLRAASLAYLAQVCGALGDAPRAAVLYRLLLPYDGGNLLAGTTVACFGAAAALLGLLATTQGHWSDAERHYEAALALNRRQGAQPALAHSRHGFAMMRIARNAPGDAQAARALLGEARADANRLGMRALLERTDQAERALDVAPQQGVPRTSYPAGLSAREAQVLSLVASGRGNREIGAQLFVSPNTVANHVRAILAKTGSVNRTEAAAFAIRHGLTRP